MRLLFIYDMTIYSDGKRNYNYMFNEDSVNRYKSICKDLYVCAEFAEATNNELSFSSHSNMLYRAVNITKINTLKKLFKSSIINKGIIKNAIAHTDYVIIRTPSSVAYTAFQVCKSLNKPFIVEMVGCPWDSLWNHSLKGKLVAPFLYYSTHHIVKNSPYVIYVTNEFLQKRYPTDGECIGCSDVELSEVDETILKQRLEKISNTSDTLKLCTIGAVDISYKGQQYVIKAISELIKKGYCFEYHIIGSGNPKDLQVVAKKYNVSDKVKFVGALPHNEIFKYLDKIDVYIQPSLTEGLSRAIIEAMNRACPVVGSVYGGTFELVNKEYVFNPKNTDQICNILMKFNKEVMRKEARRSYNLAKEFDFKLLESKRNNFYANFFNKNKG